MSVSDNFRSYNTIYYDAKSQQLKGKDTLEGEQQLLKNGKRLLLASKEQIASGIIARTNGLSGSINDVFQEIQRECENLLDITELTSEDKKEIFDAINTRMVRIFVDRVDKNIDKQRAESSTAGAAKPAAVAVPVGRLAADLQENLMLDSEEDFQGPISPKEAKYIESYLKDSVIYQKWKAHYEMLQKATNNLKAHPIGKPVTVESQGKAFQVYDIDGEDYRFFGCAAGVSTVIEDYEGYETDKWKYLCTSLIDENLGFYDESETIFQILSISPETIMFTYAEDAYTPVDKEDRESWNNAARRALVVTDRMVSVILAFKQIVNSFDPNKTFVPLYDKADQETRDKALFVSIKKLLKFDAETTKKHAELISDVRELIIDHRNVNFETIKEIGDRLIESELLPEKDVNAIKEYLIFSQAVNSYKTKNSLVEGLVSLERFFSNHKLSPNQQKIIYLHLFQNDDPEKRYNIVKELRSLINQAKNIPKQLELLPSSPWLNRIKGPGELLGETMLGEYNEINLNTTLGDIAVKGWLIPKHTLNNIKDKPEGRLCLEFAAQEGIPIFTRTIPPTG